MSKFKVGDRVRATTDDRWNGRTAQVRQVFGSGSNGATKYDVTMEVTGEDLSFCENELRPADIHPQSDPVNHPSHYTAYKGIEVIQLTEQMNFNRGNAVKYTARAGLKNPDTEIEDIKKAVWYLQREIQRLEADK